MPTELHTVSPYLLKRVLWCHFFQTCQFFTQCKVLCRFYSFFLLMHLLQRGLHGYRFPDVVLRQGSASSAPFSGVCNPFSGKSVTTRGDLPSGCLVSQMPVLTGSMSSVGELGLPAAFLPHSLHHLGQCRVNQELELMFWSLLNLRCASSCPAYISLHVKR